MSSLSERFKQMEQIRKQNGRTTSRGNVPKQEEILKEIPRKTKVTKKSITDRLGPKKKTLEDRLGKTVVERLGKPLPKGTVVVGNHILGPRPARKRK
jgi:predicted HTH transcriptional regulator